MLRAAGIRVGVKVHPHRLRHTAATQLLNAGCRVTSIQKFLGHMELSTTMIYARVHDQTVAEDYYTAMSLVEERLELLGAQENFRESVDESQCNRLLELVAQLAEPELSLETRLEIVTRMRQMLTDVKIDGIAFPQTIPAPIQAGFG